MARITYWLTAINVILICIGSVVLAQNLPRWQIDLTKNQIHSVSASTKNYIKNLSDVVNIQTYVSSQLPPEIKPLTQSLNAILSNFSATNPSKIKVEKFDPTTDTKALDEADKNGIRPLQFSSVKNDKVEVQKGYFGMVLSFRDKKEVIPVAGDVGNLEYYLLSTIDKMANPIRPKILVAFGNGEWGQDQISLFQRFISSEYTTIPVNLNEAKELDPSAGLLLLVGPKGKYNDKALGLIKSWIEAKKSIAIWLDKYVVNDNLQSAEINTGLEGTLAQYGFKIKNGLVLDDKSGIASFSGKSGTYVLNYPYWPKVESGGIDKDNPSVSALTSLVFPWTSSLNLSGGQAKSLLKSNSTSYLSTDLGNLNPALSQNEKKPEVPTSSETIGAILENGYRINVIADADFIRDQFVMNNQQNLSLALNLIDWLNANNSLIQVRSKQVYVAPLAPLADNQKLLVKIFGTGLCLLSVLLIAGTAYVIRRRNNIQISREYVGQK